MHREQLSSFEPLESRQLFAAALSLVVNVRESTDGALNLVISGTKRDDRISIEQNSKGVTVQDGKSGKLFKGKFKLIKVDTGKGNDRVFLNLSVTAKTSITTGDGNDSVVGGRGNDTILAGAGNDSIYGSAGNDYLIGEGGNDSLYGNDGNDMLAGGAGDDDLVTLGGGRYDSLNGGAGTDAFWTDASSKEKVLDTLDAVELYNGAWHRVAKFVDYFDLDGQGHAIPLDLKGDDLPDPTPDFEGDDQIDTADGFEDFSDRSLFGANGPSMDDIKQGNLGDCFFLSTLAAATNANPQWVRQSIVEFGDGTFGVRFLESDNSETYVRIDGELPVVKSDDGSTKLAYGALGQHGETWVALMEKAFAYYRNPENANDGGVLDTSYHNLNGGWLDEPMTALGGQGATFNDPQDGLPFDDGYAMLEWIQRELADGRAVTLATNDGSTGTLVGPHAYTVLDVIQGDDGDWYLKLRNPWARDGGTTSDGVNDGYVFVSATEAFARTAQIASATV